MLRTNELEIGFNDAENYSRKENKERFQELFVRNSKLEKLLDPAKFFLIGDKGTGKTAYAVWLSNIEHQNTSCHLSFIRETEYNRFLLLKKEKHLTLSDFTNIWKVLLYLLLAQHIYDSDKSNELLKKYIKYRKLKDVIDLFYEDAFSPEILKAVEFVEQAELAADLFSMNSKIGGTRKENASTFQIHLLSIQKQFEEVFSSISLPKNYVIFVDGIDIRPTGIPYAEYLECVKGLANAVWTINNDFFSKIKDSKGRMKVVLLLRPDIFNAIALQNANNKIRDNSVVLDWRIRESDIQTSGLFELANKLLETGQNKEALDSLVLPPWSHYFPYKDNLGNGGGDHSFVRFLRNSYHRPRDIVTMLSILKEIHEEQKMSEEHFKLSDVGSSLFKKKYSDHLLGELRDQISFYYSDTDYQLFIKFFSLLNGKVKFNFSQFKEFYSKYIQQLKRAGDKTPKFASTPQDFIQFLFELNVISCVQKTSEGKPYFSWCFKDKTTSNNNPNVTLGCEYEVFYGLRKSLNVGSELY